MKVLHTSDWHLGCTLYGRKRYDEFSAFLAWLPQFIDREQIDILLIAGDVFNTGTPSNRAQELYYRFLCQIAHSRCRHVIIIGGNHDSPSFLRAPAQLLRGLGIHVVGAMSDNLADEVILVRQNDQPEALICAVPYLRDKDIRTVTPGESLDDKNKKLINGLKAHYVAVCQIAADQQANLATAGHENIPIIAMGHLFTAGAQTIDGDGVRDLYVGSLAHIGSDLFPDQIDYLALGHLHVPQIVGKNPHMRYCGSVIPMGFGEAKQQKKIIVITFQGKTPSITEHNIPCFQQLVTIRGNWQTIETEINKLRHQNSSAWLEIEYISSDIITNLSDKVAELVAESQIEVLRIKNRSVATHLRQTTDTDDSLNDLTPMDVFERLLDTAQIDIKARPPLIEAYQEILRQIDEQDHQAE